jgi:hypothetical protein
MSYRDDVDALAARHAALETEADKAARERDRAGELLREARARAKLPVLDNIRVAAPCSARWDAMTPVDGDRVRHCGDCNKRVYNLSMMTRDEAEALLIAHEGKLCVRYYRRADGTILTKDCAVGVGKRRRRRFVAAGILATFATGAAAYVMRTRPSADPTVCHRGEHLMGDVAGPPPMMGAVAIPQKSDGPARAGGIGEAPIAPVKAR